MQSYTWSFKLLHWLMAGLIILMFFAFLGFEFARTDSERIEMLLGHSSLGTIITVLLLIRLLKRFVLKQELPTHQLTKWQSKIAKSSHYLMYALMLLVPLSGYLTANFHELPVMVFGSFPLNGTADDNIFSKLRIIHSTSIKLFIALIALHIGAALLHKFNLKDNVMYSMRPWFKHKT